MKGVWLIIPEIHFHLSLHYYSPIMLIRFGGQVNWFLIKSLGLAFPSSYWCAVCGIMTGSSCQTFWVGRRLCLCGAYGISVYAFPFWVANFPFSMRFSLSTLWVSGRGLSRREIVFRFYHTTFFYTIDILYFFFLPNAGDWSELWYQYFDSNKQPWKFIYLGKESRRMFRSGTHKGSIFSTKGKRCINSVWLQY